METATLKDLIIKQMVDLQNTVYSGTLIYLDQQFQDYPQLRVPIIRRDYQLEEYCYSQSKNYQLSLSILLLQLKNPIKIIQHVLQPAIQANEQIQIMVQKLLENSNQMLTRSKFKGSSINNNLELNPPKQVQYEVHQNKEKKLPIRITPEPNINKPCCLCFEGNENTCGKIIVVPNSIRKLQAHSQCYKNINNPGQVEFDKVYLQLKFFNLISQQKY